MQEKEKARLRESRLLAPFDRGGEFKQPSLHLFLHVYTLLDLCDRNEDGQVGKLSAKPVKHFNATKTFYDSLGK